MRRTYPTRREFAAFRVRYAAPAPAAALARLGFSLERDGEAADSVLS